MAKNIAMAVAEAVAIVPILGNVIQISKLKIDKNTYKLYPNTSVLCKSCKYTEREGEPGAAATKLCLRLIL